MYHQITIKNEKGYSKIEYNVKQYCQMQNYFASSYPHHDIQFIPSDIISVISSDILSGISIWHSI